MVAYAWSRARAGELVGGVMRRSMGGYKDFQPNIVVGVGGYASGPTLRMAHSLKIPTLIQEQNSYAGLTNKWLSKKTKKICVAYENMNQFFDTNKLVFLANQPNQHSDKSGVRQYNPLDRLLFAEMYGNYFIKGEVNLNNQGAANLNVVDGAFNSPINASSLVSTRNIEEVMKLGDFKAKVRMMNRMPHLHASYIYSDINGVLIQ